MKCPTTDEPQDILTFPWQQQLSMAYDTPERLLTALKLDPSRYLTSKAHQAFKTRVPHSFVNRMHPGDPDDPLLKQVLALDQELDPTPGYRQDPLEEQGDTNPIPGILHKYHGRALLMLSGACAVNCRYCFRRHFPYAEQRLGPEALERVLNYLRRDPTLHEIILSGGDPLILKDRHLQDILKALDSIPHLTRLRIHTRLPVVLPARVSSELIEILSSQRLKPVMVLHINHPQECDDTLHHALTRLSQAGVMLLNQSVLLKGVNDQVDILAKLSERLFEMDVLPYYLHLLDPVQGAQHFEVEADRIQTLFSGLQARLPGYLVPRFAREVPGVAHKVLWHP
jgi:L-lysine 2,3-aminomutase